MAEATILIADDEEDIRRALTKILKPEGYEILTASNGREAVRLVREKNPDIAFLDIRMPLQTGLEALEEIRTFNQETRCIILTAYLEAEFVMRAIAAGAYQYLQKPSKSEEILPLVKQALQSRRPRPEAPPVGQPAGFEDMIGDSPQIREIFRLIERISHSDVTVLIQGESGTGKELVAKAIHNKSLRKEYPYVTVDCGTLPDTLTESEIFGYEAGAFTDARKSKPGKFEMADTGTLFLDEIGNLSPAAQAKLLRALEDKKITRLGGKETKEVDVRIIAATNMELESESRKERFREDLYYRLNVFKIILPPLRDRPADIPILARHFVNRFAREQRKPISGIAEGAMAMLTAHRWRGNVRELRNVMERAVLLAETEILPEQLPRDLGRTTADLSSVSAGGGAGIGAPGGTAPGTVAIDPSVPLKDAKEKMVQELERQYILDALRKCRGNKSEAAKILDLNYKTLREKIKEYGLEEWDKE